MDAKKKEFLDYLQSFRDYYGRYHHHKETMAWAATALFLSGCFFILLKPGIFGSLYKNLWIFLIVAVLFTLLFALFFCFIWRQLKFRHFSAAVVAACINLSVKILENEKIRLNFKKTELEGGFSKGVFWPKALFNEYRDVENSQPSNLSDCITYSVLSFFYLCVLVKIMLIFFC
jgi:hypothetical protein